MKLVVRKELETVSRATEPKEFVLNKGQAPSLLLVGRRQDNDIIIPDINVSRHHLELLIGSHVLVVRDLGSRNGSYLNFKKLEPYRSREIKPGDMLQVGGVLLQLDSSDMRYKPGPARSNSATIYSPDSKGATIGDPAQSNPLELPEYVLPVGSINTVTVLASPLPASKQIPIFAFRRLLSLSAAFPWYYLMLITSAELVTSAVNVVAGLILHSLVLTMLLVHSAIGLGDAERKLTLALVLAPMIRLLSLSLPLTNFAPTAWYPLVAIPLLLTTWLIVRQTGTPRQALGLHFGQPHIQLMLVGGGLGLGVVEYYILSPSSLLTDFSWTGIVLAVFSLVLFTGFSEEVIFRGLLQNTSLPLLKKWAILYVAMVFAALHIGYLSVLDVIFVFSVGLLFGYIVYWGGSILGVSLAHGLTNVTLFLIMPYLARNPSEPFWDVLPWLVGILTALSLIAIGLIGWGAFRRKRKFGNA